MMKEENKEQAEKMELDYNGGEKEGRGEQGRGETGREYKYI